MAPRTRSAPRPKKTRSRRDAESAKEAILDAAERRLIRGGPSALRLQDIARDVGVSHPTVLHHLGSREALVKAVVDRAIGSIHRRLLEAAKTSMGTEADIGSMLDGVFEALAPTGYGRLILWLALEGQGGKEAFGGGVTLGDVVDALASMRSRSSMDPAAAREDTAHAVVLVALALVGSTVIGPPLMKHAGLPNDAEGHARFRRWLSQLLAEHLRTLAG